MAKCVWALNDEIITEQVAETRMPSAKLWIFKLMDSLNHMEFVNVAVTLWAIWTARRKAIHEAIFQSPHATHSFVTRFLAELQNVQQINA